MASYGGIFNIEFDVSLLSEAEIIQFQEYLIAERGHYDKNLVVMHWLFDIAAPDFSVKTDQLSAHPDTINETKKLFEVLGSKFPKLHAKCTCSLCCLMASGPTENIEFELENGNLLEQPQEFEYFQEFNVAFHDDNLDAECQNELRKILKTLHEINHDNDGLFWLNYMHFPNEYRNYYYFCEDDKRYFEFAKGLKSIIATHSLIQALCSKFPTLYGDGAMLLYEESEFDTIHCEFAFQNGILSWVSDLEENEVPELNIEEILSGRDFFLNY